ncbi:MAG: ABC transporter permease [Planctomycetaceae bacterium]
MTGKILGILGLLIALCLFMTFATSSPWHNIATSTFLKTGNLQNLLSRTALYGILGIGVAFVIITSGIDLSIGSMVCCSGVLLAIFLHVDYRPDHQSMVRSLNSDTGQIRLVTPIEGLQAGDRVRYSQGTRAPTALYTVAQVTDSDGEQSLTVEQEVRQSDTSGELAKALPVTSVSRSANDTADKRAQVVVNGTFQLADRDKVMLVHPVSGLKTENIVRTANSEDTTTVFLANDPGERLTAEWFAIPLRRHQRMSIPFALLSVVAIACLLGLVHGLLVTRAKLQPFVVTLCGLLIYRGLARWLTGDNPAGFAEYADGLCQLGSGRLTIYSDAAGNTFGIPYPFFILAAIGIAAAIFLNRTIWGRYLLALGRNEEAARFSGINTSNVTLTAYVICTGLAGVGGILFGLDSLSISPSSFGNFFELYAIAAAVLGGCSLRGGEGSIAGVIIGTAAMQVLNNLITLLKISAPLEGVIIGSVILIGVLADEVFKRVAAQRRRRRQN